MEKYKKVIGRLGEDEAVKYLKKKGYIILERNFNVRGGEIDVIAKKDGYIVFVEVKTRSSEDYGGGLEAVNYTKQQRMTKAAQLYLMKYDGIPARFDVIVVNGHINEKKLKKVKIEHIVNAF